VTGTPSSEASLGHHSALEHFLCPRLRCTRRCVLPTLPMGAHRRPMRPDADLSLRGLARILTEFMEQLDLRDVTLCFNDWCRAQVMIADGGIGRVGRLVLVSCDAFENYPPGLDGYHFPLTPPSAGGRCAFNLGEGHVCRTLPAWGDRHEASITVGADFSGLARDESSLASVGTPRGPCWCPRRCHHSGRQH
jgi:hypothetical protein